MEILPLKEILGLSEATLWQAVSEDPDHRRQRAAGWVTSDFRMLETWRQRHTDLMQPVAAARYHFGQAAKLRTAGVGLVERCAFVDYLRERRVAAASRDELVTRAHQTEDARRAVLEEHREYVLALCSVLCIERLLTHVGDPLGPQLLRKYRSLYAEYFATTSDRLLDGDGLLSVEQAADVALPPEAEQLKRVLTNQPV